MPELQVTTEDIQAVMKANPAMVLQVENQALRRTMGQLQLELEHLRQELENTSTKKEKHNANSGA
jgi:regulator of replication initiation timing